MTIATDAVTEQAGPKNIVTQSEQIRTEKQISLYYGERSEIRELADRIRAGLPNAGKIPDVGIWALATSAYAHDLDPWNGEIWVIYNDKKGETSLMAGIKGLRKAAKKQLEAHQHYYLNFRPILEEDYPLYGLDTADGYGHKVELAEICELRRGDACSEYSKTLRQIFDMCGSFEIAREMLGPMPVYVGIGVVREGTLSKMEHCQLVKKRAESEALKRAFDLPFVDRANGNGNSVTVGNAEEDAIEGEYEAWDAHPEDKQAPATDPPSAATEKPERPMEPEVLRDYVRRNGEPVGPGFDLITDKQVKILSGLLKGLFKGSATAEKDGLAYLSYLDAASSVDRVSKIYASTLIDLIKSPDPDDWSPSDVARKEAERVLREVYKEQGQVDMFEPEPISEETAEPTPEPQPEPPAAEKPAVKAQTAAPAPVASGKIAIPEAKPVPKSKARPETKKAEENPAEPVKDNGENADVLALKRSNPPNWLVATEWINKAFKTTFSSNALQEAVRKHLNTSGGKPLSPADGWQAAIEIAQEMANL